MHRLLPLFLLVSCGLFGLSEQERKQLASYQTNAQLYWEGGKIEQALDQVRRGLKIAPDDYKLHTIRAWCQLRLARDLDDLERAEQLFARVMRMRSEADHSPQVRLGAASAHSRIAVQLLRKAAKIRDEIERLQPSEAEVAVRDAEARQLEARSRQHFDQAEALLVRLVKDGQETRLATRDLMISSWWRGDYAAAVEYGNQCLARTEELQRRERERLEQTLSPEMERELRIKLQQLLEEELGVRAYLANIHYDKGHYQLAVEQLDRVLMHGPDRYNEYYNRGQALLALGRKEDARRDLEKFVAMTTLPTESKQVKNALRLLADLR